MSQSLTSAAAPPLADAPHAPTLTLGDRLTELRYRWWPDHVLGEILAKRWMETAIPVVVADRGRAGPLQRDPELPVGREPCGHAAVRPARSASSSSAWRW